MSSYRIQLQLGLSLPEFLDRFGTEEQCIEELMRQRWPGGFRCAHCGGREPYRVSHGRRVVLECRGCARQTSLLAGTVMQHTKLPLRTWFLAMFFISQAPVRQTRPGRQLHLCSHRRLGARGAAAGHQRAQRRAWLLRGRHRCWRTHSHRRGRAKAARDAALHLGKHAAGQPEDGRPRRAQALRLRQVRARLSRCLRLPVQSSRLPAVVDERVVVRPRQNPAHHRARHPEYLHFVMNQVVPQNTITIPSEPIFTNCPAAADAIDCRLCTTAARGCASATLIS